MGLLWRFSTGEKRSIKIPFVKIRRASPTLKVSDQKSWEIFGTKMVKRMGG